MELKEAMALRHTVRKFTNQPIDQKIIEQLNHRIDENNKKLSLSLKLVNGTKSVVNWLGHLVVPSENAINYIILAEMKNLNENKILAMRQQI